MPMTSLNHLLIKQQMSMHVCVDDEGDELTCDQEMHGADPWCCVSFQFP